MSPQNFMAKLLNMPYKDYFLPTNTPIMFMVAQKTPSGKLVWKPCWIDLAKNTEVVIVLNRKENHTWKMMGEKSKEILNKKFDFISETNKESYCMLASKNFINSSFFPIQTKPFLSYISHLNRSKVIKSIYEVCDNNGNVVVIYTEDGQLANKIMSIHDYLNSNI